jgi:glutamate decarboxylase
MEPECDKLIMASINKNYVDMDEYPVTTELQASHLLHTHTHTPFFFKKKKG